MNHLRLQNILEDLGANTISCESTELFVSENTNFGWGKDQNGEMESIKIHLEAL